MKETEVMTLLNKKTGKLETFNIHTGELVAKEGENLPTHIYSVEIADAICNLVREGRTYEEVSSMEGMPALHLIFKWRSTHPDFAKRLKDARRDRATLHHDKAVEVLKDSDTMDKDDVPVAKFRFDSYLKLAERGSPEEYGQSHKQAPGSGGAATMIVINTGISREPVTIEGVVHETEDSNRERTGSESGRTFEVRSEASGEQQETGSAGRSEEGKEAGSPSQEESPREEKSEQEESRS